jgi:hypothetical protein
LPMLWWIEILTFLLWIDESRVGESRWGAVDTQDRHTWWCVGGKGGWQYCKMWAERKTSINVLVYSTVYWISIRSLCLLYDQESDRRFLRMRRRWWRW